MARLNPFLSDDEGDEDPLEALSSPTSAGDDEDLSGAVQRMALDAQERASERREQVVDDADTRSPFLARLMEREEEPLIEGASLRSTQGAEGRQIGTGAQPIGTESLREALEGDPLFTESLQRKIEEQMDRPDKRRDEEDRAQIVDQLVQNELRSEFGGISTARDFLRQGSGVG